MEENLGPIELSCDAPPYFIVQACRQLGVNDPEDVPWHRLSALSAAPVSPSKSRLPGLEALKRVLDLRRSSSHQCACGQPLPRLDGCTFTLSTGRDVHYIIGQCTKCHCVFWEEGTVPVTAPGETP